MLFGVLSARQPNGRLAGCHNLELQGMPRLAQVSSPVPALPAELAAPTRIGPLAGISRFKGRAAGTFGVAAAISFYPAKVLGCFGDGGAVITNDGAVNERLSQLRDHGRDSTGAIVSWGLNSRLDNLHAAILDFQLTRYAGVMERRRRIAAMYTERLADVLEVTLP